MPNFEIKTIIKANQHFTYNVMAVDKYQAEDIITSGFEEDDDRVIIIDYSVEMEEGTSETILYCSEIKN